MKRSSLACVLALSVLLTGCGSILTSDQPAEQVYWLEPQDLSTRSIGPASASRLSVTLTVVPGLDTDRILVKGPGPVMSHYAGARWPDSLPDVIESLIERSLESTGLFSRVGSRSTESEIRLEVREFFAVARGDGSAPTVQVHVEGSVECHAKSGALSARATNIATANRLGAIVVAYQRTFDDVVGELAEQLQRRCDGSK